MAVTVDGVKKDEMPTSPVGKDGQYYEVKVNCGSSKTEGLWDYNAWRLNLDYIESNSKCNLTFTSSMSKSDYDEYIKSGVALRRNTYRGKNITDLWKNGTLYEQIEDGTFADIYVGDYIISEKQDSSKKNIVWLIADLDNYLERGELGKALTVHHVTIVPSELLELAQMNTTDTADGAYLGSKMVKEILGTVLQQDNTTILGKYIYPDFGNHILKYQNLLTDSINKSYINSTGKADGASASYKWVDRYLDLMSEVNLVGTTIWGSSSYDVGIDDSQYAIFRLKPELIYYTLNGKAQMYWLKSVVDSAGFVGTLNSSNLSGHGASATYVGVRPRFLIG